MPAAPQIIVELVERFSLNKDRYLSANYNEEQLRHEFINPMFEALGWDMANKQGFSDVYKDVLYEEGVASGSPDFSFRIGGVRKFFLEAKAPHVRVDTSWKSAVQLRSYAWSSKLSLSVLTDFAYFAIYDGRIPIKTQIPKVSEARIKLIPYTEYLDHWQEIEGVFSKQAILKGLFDRFADEKKNKRGTAPVDEEFLAQLSVWREKLAKCLWRDNEGMLAQHLNFAAQMTIDRIVFLRIAEDRGIEEYGYLLELSKKQNTYAALQEYFKAADAKYNSGLFHFASEKDRPSIPDTLTPKLVVRDDTIRKMIADLYPPASHYQFSHVPSEILGQVYEQFLRKVIVLKGKGVKIEEKPEVRKAGGVYYTPSYIVDYIVNNSVAVALHDKNPDQAAAIKILDPACGSGSFLLGAYQNILDWHLDYYFHNEPETLARKRNPPIRQVASTEAVPGLFSKPSYRLTISERKRILLNNIHGVDIDPQAVEVTKLSLLLKCLEGETAESIEPLFKVFRERALPDLDENIKCGNSLIAHDFADAKKFPNHQLLSLDELERINMFDWRPAFPKVIKGGGFDVVIGNPPYLYSAGQEYTEYFETKFTLGEYQTDFYVYFLEKAFYLAKKQGIVSFIVSDSWLNADSFSKVRFCLLNDSTIDLVAVFDYPVFKVVLENSVFVFRKQGSPSKFPVFRFTSPINIIPVNTIDPADALARGMIDPRASKQSEAIVKKMEVAGTPLGLHTELNRGIHAYRTDGYGKSKFNDGHLTKQDKDSESYHASSKIDETYLPELKGKNVSRFSYLPSGKYLSYGDWLAEPREPKFFIRPKIVVRKILGAKLHGAFLEEPTAIDQSLYIAIDNDDNFMKLKFILGVLLSSVGAWWLRTKYAIYDTLYPWYTKKQLASFPLPEYDERVAELASRMIDLRRQLPKESLPQKAEQIERRIEAIDGQIDERVYELYGLTKEEIQIVEGGTVAVAVGTETEDG